MKRRDLLWLWLAALAARVAAAAAFGRLIGYSGDTLYDDGFYIDMARSFLGRVPETFVTHPPGYPAFLTPFLAVSDSTGVTLARLAQLVLGAAIPALTAALAEALGLTRRAALYAGALAVVSPLLVYFNTRIMSETLFALLVLVFFLAWLRAWREGSLGWAAAAGAAGAAASLTRSLFLPFGGALAIAALLRRKDQPRWAALVAACGLAWTAGVAPWTARNWVRFHRFVPISLQGGWNLYEGMVLSEDEAARRPLEMARMAKEAGVSGTFEVNAYFGELAKKEIRERPGWFAWLTVRKVFKFWRALPYYPKGPARWLIGAFNALVFCLALLGLRAARPRAMAFVFAWALLLTALHAIAASNLRYRLPLEPFILIAAGAGLRHVRKDILLG